MKRILLAAKYVGATVAGVIVLGGAALAYMAFTKPPFPPVQYADTNVQCLPRGHRDLAEVRRVNLEIFVDGVLEPLPHNIGNTIACLTELHTHEAGQVIHAEFYKKSRAEKLTYADFFAVWDVPLERDGYTLHIQREGEEIASLEEAPLEHLKTVTLQYTTIATTTAETKQGDMTTQDTTTTSMQLTSSAFASGEMIPSIHTCDGNHVLPPLQITNVPEGTKSFVLVMDDADIPQEVKKAKGIEKFDHLIFYNIPGDLRKFTDDILAAQTFTQSINSAGAAAYTGPCPPRDLEPYTHRYSFRIYALSGNLSFIKMPTLDEVEQAAQSSALARAELIGTYTRHR